MLAQTSDEIAVVMDGTMLFRLKNFEAIVPSITTDSRREKVFERNMDSYM